MQKIKISLVLAVSMFLWTAMPVAANSVAYILQIQLLPSYINKTNFKLSCTSNGEYAQFYVNKNGGGDVAFGPSIDLSTTPCQVEVTDTQITEETSYVFTVKLNTGEASSTSTIFDRSGPDPVSGYYKDGLSNGFRLHYHTPNNTDFDHVVIYRGDTPDFSADSAHEIATVTCSRDSDMTYEDYSGDNKYYDIRAVDHAGNSSALVGDGGGTIVTETSTSAPEGEVTILPKKEGSILGTEATTAPTPESTLKPTIVEKINQYASDKPGLIKWVLTHKKISIGVLAIIGILGYQFYMYGKRNR